MHGAFLACTWYLRSAVSRSSTTHANTVFLYLGLCSSSFKTPILFLSRIKHAHNHAEHHGSVGNNPSCCDAEDHVLRLRPATADQSKCGACCSDQCKSTNAQPRHDGFQSCIADPGYANILLAQPAPSAIASYMRLVAPKLCNSCATICSAMEVLSAAASGMAVASLSIQLIDSIGTIRTFIRNVKDAPKELERLVDLLDRLSTLLESVRDLMERQTSLQADHFPTPSTAILEALKSCEKTIQPLCDLVEKFKSSTSQKGSTLTKFMMDLKLAFKAKNIAELDARIERDINHLHTLLGVNTTAIL